jgi:antitoxin (DNA-binding transcriptional repressor) of toxin-antitoxin stability system
LVPAQVKRGEVRKLCDLRRQFAQLVPAQVKRGEVRKLCDLRRQFAQLVPAQVKRGEVHKLCDLNRQFAQLVPAQVKLSLAGSCRFFDMLHDFIPLHDLPPGSSVLNFYYKYLAWLIEAYLLHISFSF